MPLSPWDLHLSAKDNHSNLQTFLRCVTPTVPVQALPKNLSGEDEKLVELQYSLSDLWKFYDEGSAYGVDVPVILNKDDTVVQYYTPSLSAIQIYTKLQQVSSRNPDSNPNGCCNTTSQTIGFPDNKSARLGYLYFQYNETTSPYERVPLATKVDELAKKYPGLKSFTTSDLSPYSWMAIAWYPIYQVPAVKGIKELSARFITYHTLSSSFQGMTTPLPTEEHGINENFSSTRNNIGSRSTDGTVGEISPSPFAMASYNMFKGALWLNPKTSDREMFDARQDVACSWLRHLNFNHHDFSFFTSQATCTP